MLNYNARKNAYDQYIIQLYNEGYTRTEIAKMTKKKVGYVTQTIEKNINDTNKFEKVDNICYILGLFFTIGGISHSNNYVISTKHFNNVELFKKFIKDSMNITVNLNIRNDGRYDIIIDDVGFITWLKKLNLLSFLKNEEMKKCFCAGLCASRGSYSNSGYDMHFQSEDSYKIITKILNSLDIEFKQIAPRNNKVYKTINIDPFKLIAINEYITENYTVL